MADVFVSYKREDRARVKPLVDALSAEGFTVWWDVGIEGGAAWRESIRRALGEARCVVVVWSAASVGPAGEFVHDEASLAKRRGLYLPVAIDDVPPPLGFGQVQALSMVGWRGRRVDHRFRELAAAARGIIAGDRPNQPMAPESATKARSAVGWRPWAIGLAALAALLAAAGAWLALGHLGTPAGSRIAILPFETTDSDASSRSLADGVGDEVARTMTSVGLPTLSLDVGRAGNGEERDETAVKGGAAYALGGHVQRDGGALNVSVHIGDPRTHAILWSKNFSRPAAEAGAMREQVATTTVRVLQCAFDVINLPASRFDNETVGLYLRACDLRPDYDSQDQVRDLLRQVTQRQPRFATGWAKLALAASSARHTLPADQAAAAERESRAAAKRALQLDPRNGIPYIALNDLLPSPGHLLEHQNLILKGLSVSPDNAVLNLREGDLLSQVGRVAEALVYGRRAEKLDPLNPIMAAYLTGFLLSNGLLTEARAVNERAATLWPDGAFADFKGVRIAIEARYGDPDKALALIADPKSRPAEWEPSDIDDWRRRCLIRKSHDPAMLARYASEQLAELASGKSAPSVAMSRLSALGAVDGAFEAAAKASPADTLETGFLFRPTDAGMRRDPRFMPLMAKVGLVDFWRKTGKWPDFCEAADRPYDCRAVAAKLAPS
jgi:TolB-like protein